MKNQFATSCLESAGGEVLFELLYEASYLLYTLCCRLVLNVHLILAVPQGLGI